MTVSLTFRALDNSEINKGSTTDDANEREEEAWDLRDELEVLFPLEIEGILYDERLLAEWEAVSKFHREIESSIVITKGMAMKYIKWYK